MAKGKGDTSNEKGSKVKRLGIATVVRPCLVGAFLLTVLHAALPVK